MTTTAYKDRIALAKSRLDQAIKSDAKRFGHHGPKNLIETVRQRHSAAITEEYAAQLCRDLAGWKG